MVAVVVVVGTVVGPGDLVCLSGCSLASNP